MTFSPDGPNVVVTRPLHRAPSIPLGWFQDASTPGAGNGTVITASLLNEIIANLRTLITGLGGGLVEGSDTQLLNAITGGMCAVATYDPSGVGGDAFDMDNMTDGTSQKVLTAPNNNKLGYLTVTGPVNLDNLQTQVEAGAGALTLKGSWDASAGTFPGGGTAQAGWTWVCTVAGTVGGQAFAVNDQVSALITNASTTVYTSNWQRLAAPDVSGLLNNANLTGSPTAPTPALGDNDTSVATTAFVQATTTNPGLLFGLGLSNSVGDIVNDIAIAVGRATTDVTPFTPMILSSGLTKRLDANWVAGNNAGGLDTGTVADGTYHVYLIQRSDNGTVDALFSTNVSSPTMPTNYDRKRRIGSILREGGSLVQFNQYGDLFKRIVAKSERTSGANFAAATLAFAVPQGIRVRPIIQFHVRQGSASASSNALLGDFDGGASNVVEMVYLSTGSSGVNSQVAITDSFMTNTLGQLYFSSTGDAWSTFQMNSLGWWDGRGRAF